MLSPIAADLLDFCLLHMLSCSLVNGCWRWGGGPYALMSRHVGLCGQSVYLATVGTHQLFILLCFHGRARRVYPGLLVRMSCSTPVALRVVALEEHNKMSPSNLGIVFGPTLMRPRPTGTTVTLSSLVDYPHQARIVEMLVVFYGFIFPVGSGDSSQPTSPIHGHVTDPCGEFRGRELRFHPAVQPAIFQWV